MDFALTAEQRMLVDTARDFAGGTVAAAAAAVRAGAGWQPCAEAFGRAGDAGLTGILVPAAAGGGGGTCRDLVLVLEEAGAADVAIAANCISLPATMALMLARAGGRPFVEAVPDGRPVLLAGALNEPDVAGADLFAPAPGPGIGMRSTAVRPPDGGWVLDGRKVGFVTNGGVADGYLVVARADVPGAGAGPTAFWVPAGTPGLGTGPRTHLAGWPTGHHAEVLLDAVRVPDDAVVGVVGGAGAVLGGTPEMAVGLAACFVGLARAAYTDALAYARSRVSWGRPIVEHQAVALKLAGMRVRVDAARLLVQRAAWAADGADPVAAATVLAPSAKAYAVDTAIEVCGAAVEVFGGYGVAAGSPAAARLADAWVGYACDFPRELLLLSTVPHL